MEPKKKPNPEFDDSGKEFRMKRASELNMPCPVCCTRMEYVQSGNAEGWYCSKCNKLVPIGTADEAEKIKKRDAVPSRAPKDTNEIRKSVERYRKRGRRSGGCEGC